MYRLRWGTAFAGAAVVALALGGCAVGTGGASDDDADYDADAELSGKLSVMGFSGVDEVATSRMDYAEAELGDVDVKLIEGDLDIQQFLSAVASGKPPELVYADRDQIGSLAARGAVIPLDRCIDGEGIDMDQFREAAVGQVTLDGKVYGIPEFNQV
ncbi:MAG TPA: extracellular solute-binding protein, partial [Agromyces sp.]|nr:extracellular solute-binding protein [Agromyces sp.]